MLFSKLIKRYLIQILASGMLFFSAFASAHEGHTTYGTAYHLLDHALGYALLTLVAGVAISLYFGKRSSEQGQNQDK
ncbi:MAG: hypothetical protein COA42_12960 [Alteromonadaceae bacterium]|nr:MAG: hypothetical protein COA42_12960 [Alteromonadaceae bacterium]